MRDPFIIIILPTAADLANWLQYFERLWDSLSIEETPNIELFIGVE